MTTVRNSVRRSLISAALLLAGLVPLAARAAAPAAPTTYRECYKSVQSCERTRCRTLDGRDQMLHLRQFKVVHWTKARLLAFDDRQAWTLCGGEHDGYRRHPGHCVHRRSVLFVKDDLWIVVDRVTGSGDHQVRLQWLGGEFPWTLAPHGLELETPKGAFCVSVRGSDGTVLPAQVEEGQDDPPAGWLARHYGVKTKAPSLVVQATRPVPLTWVSVLSAGTAAVDVDGSVWRVRADRVACGFTLADGRIANILSDGA